MGPKSVVLFCLLLCLKEYRGARQIDRDLIGWSERLDVAQEDLVANPDQKQARFSTPVLDKSETRVEVLSWEPRIFLLHNLLTEDECDYVINKATPRLARSGVVDEGGEGKDAISDVRTSNGMFFERGEDPIIQRIEERLSKYSLIPVGNGEGMQVLRYEHGQEYKPHFDYFFHPEGESNGGNRLATVLMYLQGAEEGGETVFPNVPKPATQTKENGFSECSMQGLAVKAKRGDAVLFFSLKTDGVLDRGSLHGSCPTSKGTKWAATKWFHVAHYAMGNEIPKTVHHVTFKELRPPAPPGCKDEHTSCEGWAEAGECDSNPGFMVGIKGDPGKCLLSCGKCDLLLEVKAPNERTPDEV